MNISSDINNKISDFLNLEDLENASKSLEYNNDFNANLLKKQELFETWLKKQPIVNKNNTSTIKIRNFIYDSKTELYLRELDNVTRKYIHKLSSCAGLKTKSIGDDYYEKDMIITKPPDYKFDSTSIMDIKTLNEKIPIRMIECDMCSTDINVKEALYNYRGIGPLCESCVESDHELAGLKWENIY